MERVTQGIGNIVVVGSWNKAILSPDWVKEYLLNDYASFEIAYPVNGGGSLKFTTSDFSFLVIDGRLQFELISYTEESMRALSRTARKMFRLLGHTPISAMGINFVYREAGTAIPSITVNDNEQIASLLGCSIGSQQYQRVLTLSDTERLLIIISCEDSYLTYSFNFDYRLSRVSDILNILGEEDDILISTQKRADNIIDSLFSHTSTQQ